MVNILVLMRAVLLSVLLILVTACSYIPWFGDDEEVVIQLREPVELFEFVPEARVQQTWQVSIGGNLEDTRILLHPHVYSDKIAFASTNGSLAVYESSSGRSVYSTNARDSVSAGVGGNDQILVLGTLDGEVVAINQSDGSQAWSSNIGSEVVAIAHAQGELAIIRTNDNHVFALSIRNGEKVWTVSQTSPALTLRGASVPVVKDGVVYAGMDNGKVIAISLDSGTVIWESRVSIPSGRSELDRLVDIDGQLAIDEQYIYAASYHGRVAAISRVNGRIVWARDIASSAGVSIDNTMVFVTDRDDNVWALEKDTGISVWKQEDLLYRQLSAPVVQADTILVGDLEGFIHVIAKQDGRLIGRSKLAKSSINTSPLSTNSTAYITDVDGRLAAYTVVPVN